MGNDKSSAGKQGAKSEKLTDEQNEICYTIKLELMRAILEIKQDDLWRLIERVLSKQQTKSKESEAST
jgi:hypothetical protein